MKALAAILLLGILLFNWVGYRLLNGILQDKADQRLITRLDHRQYDRSQLISIKVPVIHLSYYNSSAEFQRVDGQVEIRGIPYRYVERRIYNDSLELLCIPDQKALKLRMSRDEYFKLVNAIQQPQQGQEQIPSKSFIGDPYMLSDSFQWDDPSFTVIERSSYFFESLPSIPPSIDERPPTQLA